MQHCNEEEHYSQMCPQKAPLFQFNPFWHMHLVSTLSCLILWCKMLSFAWLGLAWLDCTTPHYTELE